VDIGCGTKPYQQHFKCTYIGVDPAAACNPDVIANANNIPLPDNMADGIVMNQSLEHILDIAGAISEVKRLLKPNGRLIVTVPHAMKIHSSAIPIADNPHGNIDQADHPYWHVDFWRFTKFGLIELFKDFKISKLEGTTGYIGTLALFCNYAVASLHIPYAGIPLYLVSNVFGVVADRFFLSFKKSANPTLRKIYHFSYSSLPSNYILIAEKL